MSVRRLWTLVSQLPQDCALARALYGEDAEWSLGDMLTARVGNLLMQANSEKRVPESDLVMPPAARKRPARKSARQPAAEEKPGTWQDLDALFTGGQKAG